MTRKSRPIPNPNQITKQEFEFIKGQSKDEQSLLEHGATAKDAKKAKGRMISMSDTFWNMLNTYLTENPTEGSRSSFIVRIVAEYIRAKTSATHDHS